MENQLSKESSLYLKQHAENPVHWYSWGEEALSASRRENKPIFLSIGYSSCHWCHVMAHESFENPETAKLMNELYINIKVDREERPDLDHLYQKSVQLLTGRGGWPLSVFLTPDLKPYFSGTYFPPEDRFGILGFKKTLKMMSEAFHQKKEEVKKHSYDLAKAMREMEKARNTSNSQEHDLRESVEKILSRFDWERGGMGYAPKFPQIPMLQFLWRASLSLGIEEAKEAVLLTLQEILKGGIYDQLGGGIHRYSVDPTWSVPHFEKMLYDQALLIELLSEILCACSLPGLQRLVPEDLKSRFYEVLEQSISYLLREMRSKETHLFYSSQDADSEGEEGKYFCFSKKQLDANFSENEAKFLSEYFGVFEKGNFENTEFSVLRRDHSSLALIKKLGLSKEEYFSSVDKLIPELFLLREKRIKPETDQKIKLGWNAMVVSSLLWAKEAFLVIGEEKRAEKIKTAALQTYFKLLETSKDENKEWISILNSAQSPHATLEDLSFFAKASFDGARFEKDPETQKFFLDQVDGVLKSIEESYFDSDHHEYVFSREPLEEWMKVKVLDDQALPSCWALIHETMHRFEKISKKTFRKENLQNYILESLESPYSKGALLQAHLQEKVGFCTIETSIQEDTLIRHPHFFTKFLLETDQESIQFCNRDHCVEFSRPNQDFFDTILKNIEEFVK